MKILFLAKDIKYSGCVGIMYLSAILKKNGHDVKLVETETKDLCRKIKELSPDVIAYSATTGLHKYYLDINRKLKTKFEFFSIV